MPDSRWLIHDGRGVRRLIMRGNAVVGVEMVHMKELEKTGGRRELVSFEGIETILKVDHVIPAIGQELDSALFGHTFGQPGIFVGGDARRAGGTVSGAVVDGRRVAIAIGNYLDGFPQSIDQLPRSITFGELNVNYFDHCKGCGICAHECPVGFIAMVDDP